MGKAVYERKCLLCHGEKGDGKGPAGELLRPAPRDFTSGIYKIRSTANKIPADKDTFDVITHRIVLPFVIALSHRASTRRGETAPGAA